MVVILFSEYMPQTLVSRNKLVVVLPLPSVDIQRRCPMVVELFLDCMPQSLLSRNKLVEHSDGYAIVRKNFEYTSLCTGIQLVTNYYDDWCYDGLYLYTYK